MHYPVRDLLGRTVVGPDGRKLGEAVSLECDPAHWRIDRIRVKLTRDAISHLRLEHLPFEGRTVDVPSEKVTVEGDYLLLTEPEEELRRQYAMAHTGEYSELSPESV